ncbi:hypothetical protein Lal_00012823, partial [Lupinus albus]
SLVSSLSVAYPDRYRRFHQDAPHIIIRREYLHFIPKYSRYEKRHKNVAAHVSPAFRVEEGDQVTVGQCRPLSKTEKGLHDLKITFIPLTIRRPRNASALESLDPLDLISPDELQKMALVYSASYSASLKFLPPLIAVEAIVQFLECQLRVQF